MRIESLQYFLEIARSGSFTLAAQRLFVSQQGLSKSVKALERELGCSLFERSGKHVHLTEAGRALAPLARRCVEDYRALKEEMAHHAGTRRGGEPVRLATMSFFSNGLFTILRNELQAYGLRDVIVAEKSLERIVGDLLSIQEATRSASPASEDERRGQEDLALIVAPERVLADMLADGSLRFDPLFESRLILVGTRRFLSPRRRSITAAEVAQLPIAYYTDPVLEDLVGEAFAEHPLRHVVVHSSNVTLISEYVDSGAAVTFSDALSAFLVNEQGAMGKNLFAPIEGASPFIAGILSAKAAPLSDAAQRYVSRFKTCMASVCDPYLAKHPVTFGASERSRE